MSLAASKPSDSAAPAKVAVRLAGLWKTYPGGASPAVKDLSLDVLHGGRDLHHVHGEPVLHRWTQPDDNATGKRGIRAIAMQPRRVPETLVSHPECEN